jgi:hypothetical protein
MVLGRLDQEIDITQLGIETPGQMPSHLWYEIERDLTPEMQDNLFAQIGVWRERIHDDSHTYFDAAVNMKLLFPERASELGLDQEVWGILKQKAGNDISQESVVRPNSPNGPSDAGSPPAFRLRTLYCAKVLFPQKWGEFGIDKPREDVIVRKISLLLNHEDFHTSSSSLANAFYAKALFPHRRQEFNFGEQASLRWQREIEHQKKEGMWLDLARRAAYFKFVFPEKMDKIIIEESDWENMRQDLTSSTWPWDTRRELPLYLKMLAAEKVVPSSKGIDIIMPPRPDEDETELSVPEGRNF